MVKAEEGVQGSQPRMTVAMACPNAGALDEGIHIPHRYLIFAKPGEEQFQSFV
jgi:hypothetical protein